MGSRDETILSYHDTLICKSDMELLDGPYWLNDTLIGFYLEYLEEEVYDNSICFVRPEVTQCLKFSSVLELTVFLDPLKFKDKLFAVMPLNDCNDPTIPGGSHWSLLIYSNPEKTFFHIDSSKGSNYGVAKVLASKLSQYIACSSNIEFKSLNSIQQSNSYDCGVYVLCNVDSILKHAMKYKSIAGIDLMKDMQVFRKRREIKELIYNLAR